MNSATTSSRSSKRHHRNADAVFRWLAAMSLSTFASLASAQISFTDVTVDAKVNRQTESYGASWGDLNGDGYPDLYSNNHRTIDSLFLNRGNGTFFETARQVRTWVFHQGGDTHGGSWADFDNDGDQDLVISTGTGNPTYFLVNEFGRLVDRTTQMGVDAANIGGRLPVWLDFNGDRLPDFMMTQFGGAARLYQRISASGGFTDVTAAARVNCQKFHYGHLFDVTGDGRLDFICPDQGVFPQKIYNTLPFPWTKVFDITNPTSSFPTVNNVPDSIIGDFNNDERMDLFLLGGVQLHPSSVVQDGSDKRIEAHLISGTKGFKFVGGGAITVGLDWNKGDEGGAVTLSKIQIGAGGFHPTTLPFTLDPTNSSVRGMPPAVTNADALPVLQIGFDATASRWTFVVQTDLGSQTRPSEVYLQVTTATNFSSLQSTGLWGTDKLGRPTLLMNLSGGFSDRTEAAGLEALVQCASVTAGDFDNDMDVDLYLACSTGASNTPNILYENQGNATFVPLANAGGAAGPVGLAVNTLAGTADSVVTGDYNVDGFLDLFVTNGMSLIPKFIGGPNKLFRNDSKRSSNNNNNWIEIDLVGTQSDRDAVGARVFATANGATQLRVQNGAYHRWSQDHRRSHFGLGNPSILDLKVDLKVEWPSGCVQTFTDVAANKLYRITEQSGCAAGGIVPVALGVAPAYPCGAPPLNTSVDAGVFIWRDCVTGEWRLKTGAGGGNITHQGTITSTANYSSVKGVALTTGDTLNFTSNPKQIVFSFATRGGDNDGVNFIPQEAAQTCLKIDAPASAQVYYGPFREPLTEPLDLDTQSTCSL
jgi:hypothetical protein